MFELLAVAFNRSFKMLNIFLAILSVQCRPHVATAQVLFFIGAAVSRLQAKTDIYSQCLSLALPAVYLQWDFSIQRLIIQSSHIRYHYC